MKPRRHFIILLFSTMFMNAVYADEVIVGIWAEPNKSDPIILWYLLPDGEVKTSSNTGYYEGDLRWDISNATLSIKSNDNDHSWKGTVSGSNINAEHTFNSGGKVINVTWTAQKLSEDPSQMISLYSVCSNNKNIWEIVNIGKLEKCNSFVPGEMITSYSYEKAKNLCLALIKKRKKERGVVESCT